ncbi:MAG: hypothetical protein KDA42_14535 [Planctomycetales bacterium]|nr:hypothetical protein [Planctomycetales bacterium]
MHRYHTNWIVLIVAYALAVSTVGAEDIELEGPQAPTPGVDVAPQVPQVPPTRVEGSRDQESRRTTKPPAEQTEKSQAEQIAERLPTYLSERGELQFPLVLEEVSQGGQPPFLRRSTVIYPDGRWQRVWALGERILPGASGQINPRSVSELAQTMAKYDLSAQPPLAVPGEPQFARRVAYQQVQLQFGRQAWRTVRLFAAMKPQADPQLASPQDRMVLISGEIHRLTTSSGDANHPIGRLAQPWILNR